MTEGGTTAGQQLQWLTKGWPIYSLNGKVRRLTFTEQSMLFHNFNKFHSEMIVLWFMSVLFIIWTRTPLILGAVNFFNFIIFL